MTLIASALGLFYLITALFVLSRLRSERVAAGSMQTPAAVRDSEWLRRSFMAVSAGFYAAAGAALIARSALAVWLLGGGLLAQAVYYGLAWLSGHPKESDTDGAGAQQALSAAVISAAAFAFAAYAARLGILM